jgi:hypothetical protein
LPKHQCVNQVSANIRGVSISFPPFCSFLCHRLFVHQRYILGLLQEFQSQKQKVKEVTWYSVEILSFISLNPAGVPLKTKA